MLHTTLARKHGGIIIPNSLIKNLKIRKGDKLFFLYENNRIVFNKTNGNAGFVGIDVIFDNVLPVSPYMLSVASFAPGTPLQIFESENNFWTVAPIDPVISLKRLMHAQDGYLLPPEWLIQCFSSTPDAPFYLSSGSNTWDWIVECVSKYNDGFFFGKKRILDFGCGAGRVFRNIDLHLNDVTGCDLSQFAIDFNQRSFPTAKFVNGFFETKTSFSNGQFDLIYGISVFSHLSLHEIEAWFAEFSRVIDDDGCLFMTFNGDDFVAKYSTDNEYFSSVRQQMAIKGYCFVSDSGWEGVFPDFYQTMYVARTIIEKIAIKYFKYVKLYDSGEFVNNQNVIFCVK